MKTRVLERRDNYGREERGRGGTRETYQLVSLRPLRDSITKTVPDTKFVVEGPNLSFGLREDGPEGLKGV